MSISTKNDKTAEDAVIRHRVLLLRVSKEFKKGMSVEEMYPITRGVWKVGEKTRDEAQYALTVYRGVVQAVFCIDKWSKAVKADYRSATYDPAKPRWKFSSASTVPAKVMNAYLHKSVREYFPKGARNPMMYVDGTGK